MKMGDNMILNAFTEYFNNNLWLQILVDTYILFMVVLAASNFIFYNKKAINFALIGLIFLALAWFCDYVNLKIGKILCLYIAIAMPVFIVIIFAPDIRRSVSDLRSKDKKSHEALTSSSAETKNAIIEAVLYLSARQIGALITVEKNLSLDQYSDKAIQLNADVSKELLIQIFTPNTPLHDGAVIIRGNRVRCAGAYYVLAQQKIEDKTTGSRHRAGIGISEVSDALTIIVSEETGGISLAIEGVLIHAKDREKIQEYLDMFLK